MRTILFQKNRQRGYTIIETMIAVSLFLVVVTIGIGSLLNANLLHKKSQNMRSIMDNLSFIMEDMSRNLRTGYNYHCFAPGDSIPAITHPTMSTPKSCPFGRVISFEIADGIPGDHDDQWVYYIDDITGKIFKSTKGPYIASSFVQLTPEEVVIDSASSFAVLGAEPPLLDVDAQNQPFVIIRLVGKILLNGAVTPFSLQTSVSQRLLDT